MEITNQDADPITDAIGDPVPAASGTDGESASDLYDADRPPFGELPEKPEKAPPVAGGAAGAVPADAGGAVSRRLQVRAGAAVVATMVALVLLRRRARRS